MSDEAGFAPTHLTPPGGLATWASADTSQPGPLIGPGIEVQIADRSGEWANIVCSNGWRGWVDGGQLVDVAATRAVATELIGRLDAALKEYERAVTDAAEQRIDQAEFQRRAFQAGLVVSDHDAWFLDLPNGRWCRYDGFGLDVLDIGGR